MTPMRRFDALATLALLGLGAAIAALILFGTPKPLAVVEVTPADGAADVPARVQITVTFTRPLDEASVQAGFSVKPETEGFVSMAGRRAAFTPRFGFRADTAYTVTLGPRIRDRGGRALAREIVFRFRTRPLGLIVRTEDGRLLRMRLGGGAEPLADARVGEFTVSADGAVAYVRPEERALILEPAERGPARRIPLPPDLEVRELEWVPGGTGLLLLGARDAAVGSPYLVRLDATNPAVEPFGPRPAPIEPGSPLIVEALKKALIEIVYRRETFALTPDGRAAIVRDRNWDFVVLGLDSQRRASLGPVLAVGDVSRRVGAVAVVDLDPADPGLRRWVIVHGTDGRTRTLSPADQDSHSPRFAHRGDRLVFATGAAIGAPGERRFALEVVELATGARRRLTAPPAGASDEAPRWAPDDTWISFRRAPVGAPARGRVWVIPAEGGAASPLPIAATDARWSP